MKLQKQNMVSAIVLIGAHEQCITDAQKALDNARNDMDIHVAGFAKYCPFEYGDVIMRDHPRTGSDIHLVYGLRKPLLRDGKVIFRVETIEAKGHTKITNYVDIPLAEVHQYSLFRKGPEGTYLSYSLKDWEVPK